MCGLIKKQSNLFLSHKGFQTNAITAKSDLTSSDSIICAVKHTKARMLTMQYKRF